jgi:hypothetical protein
MIAIPSCRRLQIAMRCVPAVFLSGLLVYDYIRGMNAPKLRASGTFTGDMIVVGVFLVAGGVIWAIVAGIRHLISQQRKDAG